MSLVWVSKPVFSRIEEDAMSLSVFSYCICIFLCHCRNFNPSLCCCHHFCCPMSLFQGHIASRNLPYRASLGHGKGPKCLWWKELFNLPLELPCVFLWNKRIGEFNNSSRVTWCIILHTPSLFHSNTKHIK